MEIRREPLPTSLPPTVLTTDAVKVTSGGAGMFWPAWVWITRRLGSVAWATSSSSGGRPVIVQAKLAPAVDVTATTLPAYDEPSVDMGMDASLAPPSALTSMVTTMGLMGIVISRDPLPTSLPSMRLTTDAVKVTSAGPGRFWPAWVWITRRLASVAWATSSSSAGRPVIVHSKVAPVGTVSATTVWA